MNLDEFETQYRRALDANLNRLQTAVLLIAQFLNYPFVFLALF